MYIPRVVATVVLDNGIAGAIELVVVVGELGIVPAELGVDNSLLLVAVVVVATAGSSGVKLLATPLVMINWTCAFNSLY